MEFIMVVVLPLLSVVLRRLRVLRNFATDEVKLRGLGSLWRVLSMLAVMLRSSSRRVGGLARSSSSSLTTPTPTLIGSAADEEGGGTGTVGMSL